MKMRILFQVIFFLFLHTVLTIYIGWNVWIWLHAAIGFHHQWIFGFILFILSYSYAIGRFAKKLYFFTITGSYWLAILQYAVLLLPLADLAYWILHLLGLSGHTVTIWTGIIVLVAFAGLFSIGTFNAYSPIVRTYPIFIAKRAGERKMLRIAMASDMHFGNLSGRSHLKRMVKVMKKLNPDIILLPGDIIDDDPAPFMRKKMGDLMKELNAPLGIFGVLGNHEYYGGAIPEFTEEMERIGVTILLDQKVKIDNAFFLVGRKDKTDAKRESMEKLLSDVDKDLPIIVMDHQPTELKQAETYGADLLLSGHTHKGQMAPNHFITRKVFELDWGYLKKNSLHAIVSSGYGFWGPPIRIGSRSEVVQIDVSFLE